MPLATLSDLENSISSWLARSDLTAQIPDFITLCESDLLWSAPADGSRGVLRVRQMEGRSDAPTTNDTGVAVQYIGLPPDFLEMRSLRILAPDPGEPLELVTSDYIAAHWPNAGSVGRPQVFAIVGPEIMLGPAPDAVYQVEIDYYAFTPLSVLAPSNWLLTGFPAVYLFGSLMQAMPFTRNDARAATWGDKYERALAGLIAGDRRARWPLGNTVARPQGCTP